MGQIVAYIESYLASDKTPGAAGNMFWVLVYIMLVFGGLSVAVIAMNWLERKILAHMQVRLGPMRVGPHGLLQPIADAIKLMLKEDIIPSEADQFVFWIAPLIGLGASWPGRRCHCFHRDPLRPVAGGQRHEHRHPLYARRLVARCARRRHGR